MANNVTTSANHFNGTTAANGFFSTNNLNNEFLPYFAINGAFMTWYDVAVIRLCDVCDFFRLCPRFLRYGARLECGMRQFWRWAIVQVRKHFKISNDIKTDALHSFQNLARLDVVLGDCPSIFTGWNYLGELHNSMNTNLHVDIKDCWEDLQVCSVTGQTWLSVSDLVFKAKSKICCIWIWPIVRCVSFCDCFRVCPSLLRYGASLDFVELA